MKDKLYISKDGTVLVKLIGDYDEHTISFKGEVIESSAMGISIGEIDVEKLSEEEYPKTSSWRVEEEFEPIRRGYLKGYNKAMELNKDKLFTEDQMWNMFYFGDSLKRKIKSGNIDNKPMGEIFDDYIKSLQQPKEIKVEIEMDICGDKVYEVPEMLLDENGCLILKKK